MKIKSAFFLILLASFTLNTALSQESPQEKGLNSMIIQGMKDWKVPGLTTVVVKDGEVVFKNVYGVKDLKSQMPVDGATLFSMASTTKAIVSMALGILVDQGKLSWEDKVQKHLPDFQLSDPYITREARIKDLLTHNLGIKQADLLWTIDSISTKETLKRFSRVEKGYPIRGGYAYNNLMYAVAGEVIAAVSGKDWGTFVKEHILKPLNMSRTLTRSQNIYKSGNYATPHDNDPELGTLKVAHTLSDQIGAAGMMWSSADDIGNYLKFLVNEGVYGSDTLIKPATFRYLFKPQALVTESGFYPTQKLTQPSWRTYGLGWFQHDYRGHKLDFHTGSLPGLIAIAGVMHDKNVAVYVFANMDHAELRHAILYKAMDLYGFNDDSRDWHGEIFELYQEIKQKNKEAADKELKERVPNTSSSLELKNYVGKYNNDKWGQIQVEASNNQLILTLNKIYTLRANHWHYDTFRTDKDNRFRTNLLISFNLNAQGKAAEITLFGDTFSKE